MPFPHHPISDPHHRSRLCRPKSEMGQITKNRLGKVFLLDWIYLSLDISFSVLISLDSPLDHIPLSPLYFLQAIPSLDLILC
jgi:hypothetical protein